MRGFALRHSFLAICLVSAMACSDGAAASDAISDDSAEVDVPFALQGNLEGLLLVWFDEEGAHSASNREAIPEAHRERVRVDSLEVPPDQRLDPAFVYVADVREAAPDGQYRARRVRREQFASWLRPEVESVSGIAGGEPSEAPMAGTSATGDVILYSASWCGACRSAAAFLRRRGVRFLEKDIERDSSARSAMEATLRRAGLRSQGIPVIDFRGTVVLGFNQPRLEELIRLGERSNSARPSGQ